MARPNNGKTKNSRILSIRVPKEDYPELKMKLENMKEEMFLRKNPDIMGRTDLKDWQIRKVYEPRPRKK